MKEISSIITAFLDSQHNSEPIFLATVVNVQGSHYRQPGARMLITLAGKMVGTISGGCLENDVFQHTHLMTHHQPIVVTYNTNADQDIIWGLGLGCNGVVDVMIECLDQDDLFNPLAFIHQCFSEQKPGIMATVCSVDDAVAKVKLETRLILNADGTINTNIAESSLTQILIKDVQSAFKNQSSRFHKYQLSSSQVSVFIEFIQIPPHLIIFGAGRNALPVAELAKALGWQLTIIDCRAIAATKERFFMADHVILTQRESLDQHIISINERTVAVVMTHNYLDDLAILNLLIPANLKYLGCLGSQQRTQRLLNDLLAEGVQATPEQLQKLYAPVGIDIGADTPETIALSIIAEIQAFLTERQGGFLKDRAAPIHYRNQVKEIKIEQAKLSFMCRGFHAYL